jgi:hypothetical protein
VNAQDEYGDTPLMKAVDARAERAVQLLLDLRADPTRCTPGGLPVLARALGALKNPQEPYGPNNPNKLLAMLLDAGAKAEAKNYIGQDVFSFAARQSAQCEAELRAATAEASARRAAQAASLLVEEEKCIPASADVKLDGDACMWHWQDRKLYERVFSFLPAADVLAVSLVRKAFVSPARANSVWLPLVGKLVRARFPSLTTEVLHDRKQTAVTRALGDLSFKELHFECLKVRTDNNYFQLTKLDFFCGSSQLRPDAIANPLGRFSFGLLSTCRAIGFARVLWFLGRVGVGSG